MLSNDFGRHFHGMKESDLVVSLVYSTTRWEQTPRFEMRILHLLLPFVSFRWSSWLFTLTSYSKKRRRRPVNVCGTSGPEATALH
jgi:hypothetical protein